MLFNKINVPKNSTNLKSVPLLKSHAEAWQTTSLSAGFTNIELVQKDAGMGFSPIDVKNSSAT